MVNARLYALFLYKGKQVIKVLSYDKTIKNLNILAIYALFI